MGEALIAIVVKEQAKRKAVRVPVIGDAGAAFFVVRA